MQPILYYPDWIKSVQDLMSNQIFRKHYARARARVMGFLQLELRKLGNASQSQLHTQNNCEILYDPVNRIRFTFVNPLLPNANRFRPDNGGSNALEGILQRS
jgi:hypothetical protein